MSTAHLCRWCITQPYNRAPDIQIAALPPSAQVWARGHRHSRRREPLFYEHAAGVADRHIVPTCPSMKWASSRTARPIVDHQSPRRCNVLSRGPAVPDCPPLAARHLIPCVRLPTFRLEGRQDCARSTKSGLEDIRDDPGAQSTSSVAQPRQRCSSANAAFRRLPAHAGCFSRAVSTGILRRRFPVAAKMALATAGTIADVPGSPNPPGGSALRTIWTSMVGASFMRSI